MLQATIKEVVDIPGCLGSPYSAGNPGISDCGPIISGIKGGPLARHKFRPNWFPVGDTRLVTILID